MIDSGLNQDRSARQLIPSINDVYQNYQTAHPELLASGKTPAPGTKPKAPGSMAKLARRPSRSRGSRRRRRNS